MTEAVVATGLDQALAALAAGPATLLAGGTDLMVDWHAGRAPAPRRVVDLWRVAELRGVAAAAGGVRVGALTTVTELLDAVPDRCGGDLLRAVAGAFAAVQIRNRATLGGNLATASPAADLTPALLVLDARVRLRSRTAARELPLAELHPGYRRTVLRADELIESVWLPARPAAERRVFRKVGTRAAQAIAKVAIALRVTTAGGRFVDVAAAASAVAERVVPLPHLAALAGTPVDPGGCAAAARAAALHDIAPIDDVRSTADYRRHALARLLTTELLRLSGS